jgi:hypothetical protein
MEWMMNESLDLYLETTLDLKGPAKSAWLRSPEVRQRWYDALVAFKKELEDQLSEIPRDDSEQRSKVVRVHQRCETRIQEAKVLLRLVSTCHDCE